MVGSRLELVFFRGNIAELQLKPTSFGKRPRRDRLHTQAIRMQTQFPPGQLDMVVPGEKIGIHLDWRTILTRRGAPQRLTVLREVYQPTLAG
ncbi:MAG: hypothetical protein BWY82_00841 [Verrucomicrobia bacterium ADurb.Bin474]|nr:MAG: hypothetical protein BWY82_00841 [Verrucomicrobia bacterium ADurb.Bin474]